MSWPLDELAGHLAAHHGYPSKTAFIEGLIRWAATNDRTSKHEFSLPISRLSAREQDKVDERLLREWKDGHAPPTGPLDAQISKLRAKLKNPGN